MSISRRATLLGVILLMISSFSFSQYRRAKSLRKPKPANFVNAFYANVQLGASLYHGDLRSRALHYEPKHNLFMGLGYRVSESISVRAELGWFRLSGDDSGGNEELKSRNLSFRSDCYELTATAIYDIFHQYKLYHKRHLINPYVLIGIGVLHYSPKAELDGEWHKLRPLKTEGVEYSNFTAVIPFGVGFRANVTPHINVGLEGRYVWTFTDYLDDVSTVYQGDGSFSDPVARELADRRTDSNGQGGGVRGNPDNNDGYFIAGFRFEYVIHVPRQSYNINRNPSRFRVIKSIKKR